MNILHVHIEMSTYGGIETFIASLANEQAAMGHNVNVLSVFATSGGPWDRLSPAVQKFTLGKSTEGFSIRYPIGIYKFIRRGQYDVVHVHGYIAYYALAVLGLHKKIHFVYTLHSDAFQEGNVWDHRLYRLKRFFFRHNWVTPVTISTPSEHSFEEYYGFQANMILNGITLPTLSSQIQRNPNELIIPARISKVKNHLLLVRVVQRLVKEKYPIHLTIAGDVQDTSIMESFKPFLGPNIEYVGSVDDVTTRMQSAGALCMPSLWEGLPLTILEALSCGCIPVCSPVGGIVEVIKDEYNGFLTTAPLQSDEDSEELYLTALKRYLDLTEDARAQMRRNAILTAQAFSMTQTAAHYLDLYNQP